MGKAGWELFWTNKKLQEMVMESIGGVPVLGKL
jgi:hypothetical protein